MSLNINQIARVGFIPALVFYMSCLYDVLATVTSTFLLVSFVLFVRLLIHFGEFRNSLRSCFNINP